MPTIVLQVGQCGNQIGQNFWDIVAHQSIQEVPSISHSFLRYTTEHGTQARCVLIDTEPKVIAAVSQSSGKGLFSARNIITSQSGRGNNWAFGYSSSGESHITSRVLPSGASTSISDRRDWVIHTKNERPDIVEQDKVLLERVFDAIRLEAEDCDGAPDFMLIHSLAGGTGSGLGSRVLEELRHEYPLNSVITASVAPHSTGDTALQALNTTMGLSFLQAYADAVLIFENTDVLEAVQRAQVASSAGTSRGKTGGGSAPAPSASMRDVNGYIARQLLGALWPLTTQEAGGGMSRIRDMVQTVCPDPCMKFAETRTVAINPDSLTALPDATRSLNRHLRKFHEDGQRQVSSTQTLLLQRGMPGLAADPRRPAEDPLQVFRKTCSFSIPPDTPHQLLAPLTLRSSAVGLSGLSLKASSRRDANTSSRAPGGSQPVPQPCLSVISNRSSIADLLRSTSAKAVAMCSAGAYVHWFEKYGCPSDAILYAADRLADIADYYAVQHGMPLPEAHAE